MSARNFTDADLDALADRVVKRLQGNTSQDGMERRLLAIETLVRDLFERHREKLVNASSRRAVMMLRRQEEAKRNPNVTDADRAWAARILASKRASKR
jgi:hypothetical protein